jgi:hypothetical protein
MPGLRGREIAKDLQTGLGIVEKEEVLRSRQRTELVTRGTAYAGIESGDGLFSWMFGGADIVGVQRDLGAHVLADGKKHVTRNHKIFGRDVACLSRFYLRRLGSRNVYEDQASAAISHDDQIVVMSQFPGSASTQVK